MKIIKISKSVMDVFWGKEGWEPHTRVHVTRHPDHSVSFAKISGTNMPVLQKAMLAKQLGSRGAV